MRKELVWAAGIGITLGLIIAFGVYRIASTNSKLGKAQETPAPQGPKSEFKITLDKPENYDVVTLSPLSVSGITKPLVWVTVSGESGDYTIQSDEQGVFNQAVDLDPGVNQIKITAFDATGSQSVGRVLVVYSSSFKLKTIATPSPSESSSGSDIRQKVEEKVSQALNRPKAYIGVVTDITDSTIQIKSPESEIKQVSVGASDLSVINSKGTNKSVTSGQKQVKLADIAIGDFIVAIGYLNSNQVLDAQRILIIDPIKEPLVSASIGKVATLSKTGFTVAGLKDAVKSSVNPDSKTVLKSVAGGKNATIKLSGIGEGDLVIYVSAPSGNSASLRSLFLIQKSQS